MKNINFYNSVHITKVFCITALALILSFITACAANHNAIPAREIEQFDNQTTISEEETKLYGDNQQKWLSGLQEGLSPEDALGQVFSYLKYSFQYKEKGKFFQYIQGQYPVTCMEFGLFFEDGRLKSLLLDRAVWDFQLYRYNYARVWSHLFQYWLPNGFQEGVALIRQKSRLGDQYNDVRTECRRHVEDKGKAAKASEAIITGLSFAPMVPFVLVAMPFLPEDKIAGESEEIAKGTNEQLREAVSKIKLRVTTDNELMQLLGTPDYKGDTSWTYKIPHIKFGIADSIVIWSESWSAQDSK